MTNKQILDRIDTELINRIPQMTIGDLLNVRSEFKVNNISVTHSQPSVSEVTSKVEPAVLEVQPEPECPQCDDKGCDTCEEDDENPKLSKTDLKKQSLIDEIEELGGEAPKGLKTSLKALNDILDNLQEPEEEEMAVEAPKPTPPSLDNEPKEEEDNEFHELVEETKGLIKDIEADEAFEGRRNWVNVEMKKLDNKAKSIDQLSYENLDQLYMNLEEVAEKSWGIVFEEEEEEA